MCEKKYQGPSTHTHTAVRKRETFRWTCIINDRKPKIFSDVVSFACVYLQSVSFFCTEIMHSAVRLRFFYNGISVSKSKVKRKRLTNERLFYFSLFCLLSVLMCRLFVCFCFFSSVAGELLHFNKLYHFQENTFKIKNDKNNATTATITANISHRNPFNVFFCYFSARKW